MLIWINLTEQERFNMKAKIVVHTQSGNTAKFAREISEKLNNRGIENEIALLRPTESPKPNSKNVELKRIPDIDGFDTIILGCPVWGLTASPVILAYIDSFSSMKGKKIIPFATFGLPFKFMGASKALKVMTQKCDTLLGDVLPGYSLHTFTVKFNNNKLSDISERIASSV